MIKIIKYLPAFLLVLLCLLQSNISVAASFDCKKSRTEIEKTICSNELLGNLDIDLDKSYKFLQKNLSELARAKLRINQLSWLKTISLNCDNKLKVKEPLKYIECLQATYKGRITYLKESSLAGFFKYPSAGVHRTIAIELLDSDAAVAILVNDTVKKLAGSEIPFGADKNDYEGGTNISINSISPSILVVEASYYGTHGGGGVSFDNNWKYVDIDTAKILDFDYFFVKSKISEFSRAIHKKITLEADKDTLDCYENINEKSISEIFQKNFSYVNINRQTIVLELDVPRYCKGSKGSVELNARDYKIFMTDKFRSIIN